jgi:hypothetical protein
MSRIMRSTVATVAIVAGIALTLTLGATAAAARPLQPAAGRKSAPVGIAETVRGWWNDLTARWSLPGRGGLSALSERAGSQMDPNGGVADASGQRTPPPPKSPDL